MKTKILDTSQMLEIFKIIDLDGYLFSETIGHPCDDVIELFFRNINSYSKLYEEYAGVPTKSNLHFGYYNLSPNEETRIFKAIIYDTNRFDRKKILTKIGLEKFI